MQLLTLIPALQSSYPIVENLIDELTRHKTKVYPTRSLDDVNTFVFHHMASEAPLMNQANFHVNRRGWAGLGYHIVIWGNRIIQANPLDLVSNHTSGHNPNGIGVAVLGDLSKRSITPMERKLSAGVLASLNALLPGRQIKGHNQLVRTACPCTDMDEIRGDVSTLELNLALNDTQNDAKARIYAAYGRCTDLYKLATQEGKYREEAQRKWLQIEQAMVDAGVHIRK